MNTKICSDCKIEKELTVFHKRGKSGRQAACMDCQKEYHRVHYQNNRQKYKDNSSRFRENLREEVNNYKCQPCLDCGREFNPWQMDFDHLDGETKIDCIANFLRDGNSVQLWKEILKCELVCANCHRDRTHMRSLGIL